MDQATAPVYEIGVPGVLGETLLSAFPALSGTSRDGDTVLAGCLDQAALHGVLHGVLHDAKHDFDFRQISWAVNHIR